GWTVFHYVAASGFLEVAKVMADDEELLAMQTPEGLTPLHLAIVSENLELIRVLLDKKADVSIQDGDGLTARDYAESMNPEMVKMMDEYANVHSVNRGGNLV